MSGLQSSGERRSHHVKFRRDSAKKQITFEIEEDERYWYSEMASEFYQYSADVDSDGEPCEDSVDDGDENHIGRECVYDDDYGYYDDNFGCESIVY